MMTDLELAYLAGIIDGEGCISLAKRKKIYVTPTIQVTNTDFGLLNWLHINLGGNIYKSKETRPNRKQLWLWSIAGAKARNILKSIRPYLRIKYHQADIILNMETIKRTEIPRDGASGRLTRLSPEYHAIVAKCLSEIRALNYRGLRP